jgi:hypothetical protein
MVLDSTRTLIVWGFSLAVSWEKFCPVQVRRRFCVCVIEICVLRLCVCVCVARGLPSLGRSCCDIDAVCVSRWWASSSSWPAPSSTTS